MKFKTVLAILSIILVLGLVGCQKTTATPAADTANGNPAGTGNPSEAPGGMDTTNKLALGTFKLEGTANAVTPEQTAKLLPLWKLIQSGSLQGDAETKAVVKQIQSAMTEAQLADIEAMALTFESMQTWMQEQGIEMPTPAAGQQRTGPGALQGLSEEERAKMREEFQNMTAEQRATRMAEMGVQQPQGGAPGDGQPGGGQPGGQQFNVLLTPLIELLTKRAAE